MMKSLAAADAHSDSSSDVGASPSTSRRSMDTMQTFETPDLPPVSPDFGLFPSQSLQSASAEDFVAAPPRRVRFSSQPVTSKSKSPQPSPEMRGRMLGLKIHTGPVLSTSEVFSDSELSELSLEGTGTGRPKMRRPRIKRVKHFQPAGAGLASIDGHIRAPSIDKLKSSQPSMRSTRRVTVTDISGIEELRRRHSNLKLNDDGIQPATVGKKGLEHSQMQALAAAYFSVFLDMMGLSLVSPIMPYYAEKFHASGFELGAIYSSFSFTMMISMYIMGVASDRYGRRLAILYSLFGTAVTYVIQGLAWDYWSLLGFRVLCGAFGGSASVACALVTDVVPKAQRGKYLGFIGATVATAFIFGPGIGSGLSEFGFRVPFFVSGGLGFFGLLYAYLKLPETNPKILAAWRKKGVDTLAAKLSAPLTPIVEATTGAYSEMQIPDIDNSIPTEVKFVAALAFIFQFCVSAQTSMLGLFFYKKYGFHALDLGFAMLVLAVVCTLTTLFIFPPIVKKQGHFRTLAIGMLLETIGFSLIPVFDNVWATLSVLIVFCGLGNGLLIPGCKTAAANFTKIMTRGKIMAFVNSVARMGATIGPLAHGTVFELTIAYPFYLSAIMFVIALVAIAVFSHIFPAATAKPSKKAKRRPSVVYGLGEFEPRYEAFAADTPTEEEFQTLGLWVGRLLINRNYKWVTHYPKIQRLMKQKFPELGTTYEEQLQHMGFLDNFEDDEEAFFMHEAITSLPPEFM